jgi:hypothetical protein
MQGEINNDSGQALLVPTCTKLNSTEMLFLIEMS